MKFYLHYPLLSFSMTNNLEPLFHKFVTIYENLVAPVNLLNKVHNYSKLVTILQSILYIPTV